MSTSTENSTEKSLEKVSAGKPVSVYSVSFATVINKFPGKKFIARRSSKDPVARRSFSKKVFSWRNAAAIAAILAIGVLQFALQVSVIRQDVGETRPPFQVPPVKTEPLYTAPAVSEPARLATKKANAVLPPKVATRAARERQPEPAPLKPQSRKKESVETRAARLRRVERILTGV